MYKDHIQINENFNTSVNLALDLNSESKIKQYIPTKDICDVLSTFLDCFNGNNKFRATTLVGPYGKGKSFLLLVLSYLVKENPRNPNYVSLIKKIENIDKDLANKIIKFRKSYRLLPILINSNYDDLNQAFLLGLDDALRQNKLTSIVPETAFKECINCIDRWSQNKDFEQRAVQRCLNSKDIGISLDQLKRELGNYSKDAYKKFQLLFSCLTGGASFNPLVSDDINKIYFEVTNQLKGNGYQGLFVIFDEFSKVLEGAGDNLLKNLKLVQDFAELSSRSSRDCQINFCCVTHKSLNLYGDSKKSSSADSFKTVDGRFKEIRFNRSLEENYQIISAAFKKDDGLTGAATKYIEENKSFYKRAEDNLNIRSEAEKKALFVGCYPLNPYTVFSLINLSELCAQNERTLFTFISDVDDNGFVGFINKTDKGLLDVDKLFDYFSDSIKEDDSNDVRSIWYRTESILSKITDEEERQIVKAMAVIYIISDFDRLKPVTSCISDFLFIDEPKCASKINELLDKHYLRKNGINNYLSFATSNSREIDEKILTIKQTKLKSLEISSVCNEVSKTKFYLPRKYNEENKITRFYRVVFLTERQFFSLESFELLHNESFSDGLVINVLLETKQEEDVLTKVREIGDKTVIVRPSIKPIDDVFKDEMLQYAALSEINKEESNPIVSKEIELLLAQSKDDLEELLKIYFSQAHCYAFGFEGEKSNLKNLLSDVMYKVFTKKVIFNYELVNKNVITAQYQKSVNRVIDWKLNGEPDNPFKSPTSPENSIINYIIKKINDQSDARSVVDGFKEAIRNCSSDGVNVAYLVSYYSQSANGFGIRKGIIPILMSVSISELSINDNILLYYKQKEVDLNAENLVKAVYADEGYSIKFSRGSKSQATYIEKMFKLFGEKVSGNFRSDIKRLSQILAKYFAGLPAIVRNDNYDTDYLGCSPEVLKYKNRFFRFNLNPYETVFLNAYEDFGTRKLDEIFQAIKDFKSGLDESIAKYKSTLVTKIKELFSISSDTSLRMGMNDFLSKMLKGKSPILSENSKKLLEYIQNEKSFDDSEFVNNISRIAIGNYIEDWSQDRSDDLLKVLSDFIDEVTRSKKADLASTSLEQIASSVQKVPSTQIGELLENNLKNTISEYGDSVSNEEKVSILMRLLKEIV